MILCISLTLVLKYVLIAISDITDITYYIYNHRRQSIFKEKPLTLNLIDNLMSKSYIRMYVGAIINCIKQSHK